MKIGQRVAWIVLRTATSGHNTIEKIMKIGQCVAWRSFNPTSKSIRFGVVCLADEDEPGKWLILVGAKTIADDDWGNPDRPVGGYDVVSIKEELLTVIP